MSQKQSITAALRVKPIPSNNTHQFSCFSTQSNRITLTTSHRLQQFQLPLLFDQQSSQQQIFQSLLQPLIQDLFKGYSCAFLSCGQSSSGKSYTIEGGDTPQTKGMVSRLADSIAVKVLSETQGDRTYLLRVSYVQIWEEEVIDLLEVRRGKEPRVVEHGREVGLSGVALKHVGSVSDIEDFFVMGNRKRRFAYKKKRRSAEHSTSIFTLHLQSCNSRSRGSTTKGKLHIVDMRASKVIAPNKMEYDLSLNAFKNVVNALVFGSANTKVPYTDSKVTLFLRQFLGGSGRTSILFHVCPTNQNLPVTLDSIKMIKLLTQIQNCSHYHSDPSQLTILKRLEELDLVMSKIQQLQDQIGKVKQSYKQQQQQEVQDNQFLSKQFRSTQRKKELLETIKALQSQRITLKRKKQNLQSLFLQYPSSEHPKIPSPQSDHYVSKNKTIKQQNRSLQYSVDGLSRSVKQEIFQLQKQHQEQRESLLERIRQLQKDQEYERPGFKTIIRKQYRNTAKHVSLFQSSLRNKSPSLEQSYKQPGITNKPFFPKGRQVMACRTLALSTRSFNSFSRSPTNSNLRQKLQRVKLSVSESESRNQYYRKSCIKNGRQRGRRQIDTLECDDYGIGLTKKESKKQMKTIKSSSWKSLKHLSRLKLK